MVTALKGPYEKWHRPGVAAKNRIDQYVLLLCLDQQGRMTEPHDGEPFTGQRFQIGFYPGNGDEGFTVEGRLNLEKKLLLPFALTESVRSSARF